MASRLKDDLEFAYEAVWYAFVAELVSQGLTRDAALEEVKRRTIAAGEWINMVEHDGDERPWPIG